MKADSIGLGPVNGHPQHEHRHDKHMSLANAANAKHIGNVYSALLTGSKLPSRHNHIQMGRHGMLQLLPITLSNNYSWIGPPV